MLRTRADVRGSALLVSINHERTTVGVAYLEKDHTQSDTLDSIENAEPQPQRNAEVWSGVTRPWNVESKR